MSLVGQDGEVSELGEESYVTRAWRGSEGRREGTRGRAGFLATFPNGFGCRELMLMMIEDVAKGLLPRPLTEQRARVRLELDGRRAVGEPSKKPEDVCVRCAGRKQIKLGKRNGALLLDLSGHGTG